MNKLILKYNANLPRYTSYPTAPHFKDCQKDHYMAALKLLSNDDTLSLYLHIPYCQKMCFYCGCQTSVTHQYQPVQNYTSLLVQELKMVREHIAAKPKVKHIHFGGGSPTMLSADDFRFIMTEIKNHFALSSDVEIALEADPRGITREKVEAYADMGVNRLSFGLQDFAPHVQKAINREQSFDCVANAVEMCREFGIDAINFDLMYGLPLQTVSDVRQTVQLSLKLDPDRIALFGYAHVPWMKKHMRLIHDEDLPDAEQRLDQFKVAEDFLINSSYQPIGIDHFVKTSDKMFSAFTANKLTRNFQGYTVDHASQIIGFGASSIGKIHNQFFQNKHHTEDYKAALLDHSLPVSRGYAMTHDDMVRADVINEIMCYLKVDLEKMLKKYALSENYFDAEIESCDDLITDGLLSLSGRRSSILQAPKQIARVLASRFDTYLLSGQKKHAQVA